MNPKIIEIPVEYKPLFETWWREAAIYGGRYSLKSGTVARSLLIRAREKKTRVGCFREYQNSIADSSHQLLKDIINEYGLTDFKVTDNSIVNTVNGSDFLFKGLHHNEQSIKSIEGIDIAWVEEAQAVSTNSIEVLTPTVRKPGSQIIYTYNRLLEDDPVHKRLVTEGRPNTLVINCNYDIAIKYNMMPDVILHELEDDKQFRPALYKHKWLGEPMAQESKIFNDWAIIDEIPHEARLEVRGLDFGYARDPMALCDIYYYNGGYIVDELAYRLGMLNRQTADLILNQRDPNVLTIADSAEAKSIDEMREYGVNITGVAKRGSSGETFTRSAIGFVQGQKMSITKCSINFIKSYKNFMWQTDKNEVTISKYDHYMSDGMMAVVYGMTNFSAIRDRYEAPETERETITSLWH